MTIGQRLNALREERGLTQRQLARAAGVSQTGISLIEKGDRPNPQLKTMEMIAAALNLPVAALLTDPPAPSAAA